jgi:hypothetical protein
VDTKNESRHVLFVIDVSGLGGKDLKVIIHNEIEIEDSRQVCRALALNKFSTLKNFGINYLWKSNKFCSCQEVVDVVCVSKMKSHLSILALFNVKNFANFNNRRSK